MATKKIKEPLPKIRIAVPDYLINRLEKELNEMFDYAIDFEILDVKSKPKNVLLSYEVKHRNGLTSFTIRGTLVGVVHFSYAINDIVSVLKSVLQNMTADFNERKSERNNMNRVLGYLHHNA